MLLLCCCTAFADYLVSLGKFGINALMAPTVNEERGDDIAALCPLRRIKLGQPSYHAFVGRQTSILPVVHDQKQIGAVLNRRQVASVLEVVGNVQRHPGSVTHFVTLILRPY